LQRALPLLLGPPLPALAASRVCGFHQGKVRQSPLDCSTGIAAFRCFAAYTTTCGSELARECGNARMRECANAEVHSSWMPGTAKWAIMHGVSARPKGTTVPSSVSSPPPSSEPLLEVRRLTRLDQNGANELLKPTDFTLMPGAQPAGAHVRSATGDRLAGSGRQRAFVFKQDHNRPVRWRVADRRAGAHAATGASGDAVR
nr:hypothetical protein [Tanacetum cinerariifolium]